MQKAGSRLYVVGSKFLELAARGTKLPAQRVNRIEEHPHFMIVSADQALKLALLFRAHLSLRIHRREIEDGTRGAR